MGMKRSFKGNKQVSHKTKDINLRKITWENKDVGRSKLGITQKRGEEVVKELRRLQKRFLLEFEMDRI